MEEERSYEGGENMPAEELALGSKDKVLSVQRRAQHKSVPFVQFLFLFLFLFLVFSSL